MVNTAHRTLTGSDLHEAKGVDTATAGQEFVADGAGSGVWVSSGNRRVFNQEIPSLNDNLTYYLVCPFAATVEQIDSVIHTAITGGDTVLTGKISGTTITNGGITITQSGSAAGDVDTASPTALNIVAAGDTLEILADGVATGAVPCTITWEVTIL